MFVRGRLSAAVGSESRNRVASAWLQTRSMDNAVAGVPTCLGHSRDTIRNDRVSCRETRSWHRFAARRVPAYAVAGGSVWIRNTHIAIRRDRPYPPVLPLRQRHGWHGGDTLPRRSDARRRAIRMLRTLRRSPALADRITPAAYPLPPSARHASSTKPRHSAIGAASTRHSPRARRAKGHRHHI